MYNIGLSTPDDIGEDLFRVYQHSGISYMEISVASEKYSSLNYKEIYEWSTKYGIELWSFHLPFSPFSKLDISDKAISQSAVACLSEFIKKGSDIGIDKFVIHPSVEPIADSERYDRMECSKASLAQLAEIAKNNGAVIAVEDLPRTCLGRNSDEITELLSAHDSLRACFDTNHLLTQDPVDFIHKLGNKIVTLHVSDYDFVNERHWLPGEGKVNWQAVLQALKETGYNGVWLYEVDLVCPNTIIRDRDLTCEDIVRNAEELFAGKKPTVFSKPKENLGMWE